MANDHVWSHIDEIADLPSSMVERLHHYFATYKNMPDKKTILTIEGMYGSEHARQVVRASLDDYDEAAKQLSQMFAEHFAKYSQGPMPIVPPLSTSPITQSSSVIS